MATTRPIVIPYGQLADGSYGVPFNANGVPLAAVIEPHASLLDVDDTGNFVGRTVFSIEDQNLFMFVDDPADAWVALKQSPVVVDDVAPTDPAAEGDLYYSTNTEILYLYVGAWIAIAGKMGSGVIWRHYTGDGVTSLFPTGSAQSPPVEYVQVFVGGAALSPGSVGVRDYYMIGNDVQLNATPSLNAKIAVRSLVYQVFPRNSRFLPSRFVTDGTTNSYGVGTQMATPGQLIVSINGVVQTPDLGLGAGTYDYKINTANNSITSLTSVGTTCTAVTAVAHGKTTGDSVYISGAAQSAYNGWHTVTVTNTTTFTYTAGSSPAASPATGTITFKPVSTNDTISFYNESGVLTPLPTGLVIFVHGIESVIAS